MLLMNFLLIFLFNANAAAQDNKIHEPYNRWELGVSAGVTNFTGSTIVSKDQFLNHFNDFKSDINLGYGAFVRKNFITPAGSTSLILALVTGTPEIFA